MRDRVGIAACLRVVVVALLLAVTTFAWSAGGREKAAPLRVGYLPFAGFGPIYVAENKGWFDEAGVDVELILFDSGPPLLEAMAAGAIDMGALGGVPTLRTAAREVFDMRIISVVADVSGFTKIVSAGDIASIEGLRGRKVSAPWATTSHYLLGRALAKFGMTLDDVDFIDMEVQDAAAAFIAGRIDAFVPAPAQVNLVLNARPDAKVLFEPEEFTQPPGDTTPLYIYDLWVAPNSVIRSRPNDLMKVLDVFHGRTVNYFTNPATSRQAASDLLDWMKGVVGAEVSVEEVERQVNWRKYFTVDEMKELFASGNFENLLQEQVDFLVEVGILDGRPDFNKVMDPTLINGL